MIETDPPRATVGGSLQIQGKSHASGILGQAPLLVSSEEIIAISQQRECLVGLCQCGHSQAGWGESDNVGHLVIEESSSPLNAGCFIWSEDQISIDCLQRASR